LNLESGDRNQEDKEKIKRKKLKIQDNLEFYLEP